MKKIFVFGSNLAGRHGRGSAKEALDNWGAIYGQGIGLQGRSYGIPTKDERLNTLPLSVIKEHVEDFIEFAVNNEDMEFHVVRIGCGLAGYKDHQIVYMFDDAPSNVILPKEWR